MNVKVIYYILIILTTSVVVVFVQFYGQLWIIVNEVRGKTEGHIPLYPFPNKYELVKERFRKRNQILQENCKKVSGKYLSEIGAHGPCMYTIKSKKLTVCKVLKSGTTTWKNYFEELGKTYDYKFYHSKSTEHCNDATPGSHTAIMARHPFGRLISGWNDKMRKTQKYFGVKWMKKYKKLSKYKTEEDPTDHLMSWKDFANYTAMEGPLERHFFPAYRHCMTCICKYNYVIKTETLDQDKEWLIKQWGLPSNTTLGHKNFGSSQNKTLVKPHTVDVIEAMMRMLPINIVEKLYKIYEADFLLFGYTWEMNTMTAGGFY